MSKLFAPSSSLLLQMIKAAEAKFESDRDQAVLRREAREDARAARMWEAQVRAQSARALYGAL